MFNYRLTVLLLIALMPIAASACKPNPTDIRSELVRATPTQVVPDMAVFWPCVSDYAVTVFWRGITAELITEQNYEKAAGFMRGKNDTLLDAPLTIRADDPRLAHIRARITERLAAEKAAGTWPKDPVWVVAPNPQSTSTPPTRPIVDYPSLKTITGKRAVVGELCNCRAMHITKGTAVSPTLTYTGSQTLCWLADNTNPANELTACVRKP